LRVASAQVRVRGEFAVGRVVCCSVLQRVVVCCSALQVRVRGEFAVGRVVRCSVLQRVAACCSALQVAAGVVYAQV